MIYGVKWRVLQNNIDIPFDALEQRIETNSRTLTREMAIYLRDKAKEYCPVDTGALRKSIRTRYAFAAGRTAQWMVTAGNEKVRYAAAQEFGFRFAGGFFPGRFYMLRAVQATYHHFGDLIKEIVGPEMF